MPKNIRINIGLQWTLQAMNPGISITCLLVSELNMISILLTSTLNMWDHYFNYTSKNDNKKKVGLSNDLDHEIPSIKSW